MTGHAKVDIGCSLVGEFVDEAELPETHAHLQVAPPSNAQIERPRVVADYLDERLQEDNKRE